MVATPQPHREPELAWSPVPQGGGTGQRGSPIEARGAIQEEQSSSTRDWIPRCSTLVAKTCPLSDAQPQTSPVT